MKPVICIEMIYPQIKSYEKIVKIKEAGFSQIEFWDWKDKNLTLFDSLCNKYGIKIANFSGQRKGDLIAISTHKHILSELNEATKVAEKLGCPNLMLLSNQLEEDGKVANSYEEVSLEEKYKNIIYGLEKSINLTPESITLLLETLNTKVDHPGYYLSDIDTAVRIVREINHPRLKILADLYHLGVMGFNLKDIIRKYLPEIRYFHVADIPGRHEPGTGNINWKEILELIKDEGYEGFVGFEYSPAYDSDESLVKIKNLWQSVFPEYFK